jgi:hypothetical protein
LRRGCGIGQPPREVKQLRLQFRPLPFRNALG